MFNVITKVTSGCSFSQLQAICTTTRLSKWFTLKKKTIYIHPLAKNWPNYDKDLDQVTGIPVPINQPIKGVTEIEEFQKLPKELQKKYTYGFHPQKLYLSHLMEETLARLGISAKADLAHRIIVDTLRLRIWKQIALQDYDAVIIRRAVVHLMRRRLRNVHKLRMKDGSMFERLCNEFQWHYRPQNPRYYFNAMENETDPYRIRVLKFGREMREVKARKMKQLREEQLEREPELLDEKVAVLAEMRKELAGLGLEVESVLEEVLAERIERLHEPIDRERNAWYEHEQMQRLQYEAKREEKRINREKMARR